MRLVRTAKSLRIMFNTLLVTLPSVFNIGALLGLVYFIFAILTMQNFALVKYGGFPWSVLTIDTNFSSFWLAFIVLVGCALCMSSSDRDLQFRSSTGEAWNYLMADVAQPNEPPLFVCSENPQWNDDPPTGCGSGAAYTVLLSFTLIVSFVMMNLFVAVILGVCELHFD